MNLRSQKLVDAQTEINRAVWASNLQEDEIKNMKGSFNTIDGAKEYINTSAKNAIKDLTEFLKIENNLLF
jgi:hypothetical protein